MPRSEMQPIPRDEAHALGNTSRHIGPRYGVIQREAGRGGARRCDALGYSGSQKHLQNFSSLAGPRPVAPNFLRSLRSRRLAIRPVCRISMGGTAGAPLKAYLRDFHFGPSSKWVENCQIWQYYSPLRAYRFVVRRRCAGRVSSRYGAIWRDTERCRARVCEGVRG